MAYLWEIELRGEIIFGEWECVYEYMCACEKDICNSTLMCQQLERMGDRDTIASLMEMECVCV